MSIRTKRTFYPVLATLVLSDPTSFAYITNCRLRWRQENHTRDISQRHREFYVLSRNARRKKIFLTGDYGIEGKQICTFSNIIYYF